MKQCNRCQRWFKGADSSTCDPCWVELGQMSFWQDEATEPDGEVLMEWEDPRIARAEMDRVTEVVMTPFEDDGAAHPIDTVFDRDREMYGKDW